MEFISRGQESAGIATSWGKEGFKYAQKKGMGLVSSIFYEEDIIKLKGNLGIGNVIITLWFSDVDFVHPVIIIFYYYTTNL